MKLLKFFNGATNFISSNSVSTSLLSTSAASETLVSNFVL